MLKKNQQRDTKQKKASKTQEQQVGLDIIKCMLKPSFKRMHVNEMYNYCFKNIMKERNPSITRGYVKPKKSKSTEEKNREAKKKRKIEKWNASMWGRFYRKTVPNDDIDTKQKNKKKTVYSLDDVAAETLLRRDIKEKADKMTVSKSKAGFIKERLANTDYDIWDPKSDKSKKALNDIMKEFGITPDDITKSYELDSLKRKGKTNVEIYDDKLKPTSFGEFDTASAQFNALRTDSWNAERKRSLTPEERAVFGDRVWQDSGTPENNKKYVEKQMALTAKNKKKRLLTRQGATTFKGGRRRSKKGTKKNRRRKSKKGTKKHRRRRGTKRRRSRTKRRR